MRQRWRMEAEQRRLMRTIVGTYDGYLNVYITIFGCRDCGKISRRSTFVEVIHRNTDARTRQLSCRNLVLSNALGLIRTCITTPEYCWMVYNGEKTYVHYSDSAWPAAQ